MKKRVAVLAVNPVNGAGLFQYLEAFFENGIEYKVFAVANDRKIKTNSGISIEVDDVVANLKGKSAEFDALVFSCGDAIPVFRQHEKEQYNIDMLSVIKEFAEAKKIMIGHCAAALMFEIAGITDGIKMAVHPLAKPAIVKGIGTEGTSVCRNFYTAQDEHFIAQLLPDVLKVLKE